MHIRRTVRGVTGLASFDFHGLMLEHKWPALFGMAGVANGVLHGRCADLFGLHGAVGIVAVITFDQAFVHSMMKGHGELRLLRGVAGVAKLGLFFHQQKFGIFAVVGRMAIQAANIVLVVHGARKIHLFLAGNVAGEAALVNCLRAGSFETENVLRIAGVIRMRCAGTVASLATLMRRAAVGIERGLEVR